MNMNEHDDQTIEEAIDKTIETLTEITKGYDPRPPKHNEVWVLEYHINYEGGELVEVFASEEAAMMWCVTHRGVPLNAWQPREFGRDRAKIYSGEGNDCLTIVPKTVIG